MRRKNKIFPEEIKFPQLNLKDGTRISSNDEILLVESLIYFNGDIHKVAKTLNVEEELVSRIFLKYNQQIMHCLKAGINEDKVNASLNESLDVLSKHVKEISRLQKTSASKLLNGNALGSVTKAIDRIIVLKQLSMSEIRQNYELLDKIIKAKTLEQVENGDLINGNDYKENQRTVIKLLEPDFNNQKLMSTEEYRNARAQSKPIMMHNIKTEETLTFPSAKEAAKYFNVSNFHIFTTRTTTTPWRGEWEITVYENSQGKTVARQIRMKTDAINKELKEQNIKVDNE